MENRLLDRFLLIVLIVMALFVSYDIYRRINRHFTNNTVTVRGNDNPVQVVTHNNTNERVQNRTVPPPNTDFKDVHRDDVAKYHNYINNVIMSNWTNPADNEDLHAEVWVIIDRNGKITSYELHKSSDNIPYDRQAVDTILKTSPFQPFYGNMQGDERLFRFYFNGSRAGTLGYTYRNTKLTPLEMSINQSDMQTKTPRVEDVKRARIKHGLGYFDCATQIYDKWRPNITKESNVYIDFRVNADGSTTINTIDNNQDREALENGLNAINSAKCNPLKNENYIDVHMEFITEQY